MTSSVNENIFNTNFMQKNVLVNSAILVILYFCDKANVVFILLYSLLSLNEKNCMFSRHTRQMSSALSYSCVLW